MAQNTEFAKVALAQVGNGPAIYRKWYYGNPGYGIAWCAVFDSYCASKVEDVLNVIVPMTDGAGCFARTGVAKGWGVWLEAGAIPQVGDIVSFCWNGLGFVPGQDKYYSNHVGVVVSVEGTYFYTVEGNVDGTNDTSSVKKKKYAINNCYINGFYRPNWKTTSTEGSNGKKPTYSGSGDDIIKKVQAWCNDTYGTHCTVDGIYGTQTKSAIVGSLQCYLNKTYDAKLDVDGIMGRATKGAVRCLSKGSKGKYVYLLQCALICHGYDTGGFDGEFGPKTEAAVEAYQRKHKLEVDGIAGPETFYSLLK